MRQGSLQPGGATDGGERLPLRRVQEAHRCDEPLDDRGCARSLFTQRRGAALSTACGLGARGRCRALRSLWRINSHPPTPMPSIRYPIPPCPGARQLSVTDRSAMLWAQEERAMREYQPVSSSPLSAIERPHCPACNRSRMVLSEVEPGPGGFDFRTFECQKCGHVHKVTISKDPMESGVRGWLNGDLKSPV